MDTLRLTQDPLEIFENVLLSLELHRPSKAERDILDDVRDHYGLPGDTKRWAAALVDRGVSPDGFLKYVLDRLSPFVEMVVDIYEFLHSYVSTSGGQTRHFVIESDDLSEPWSFDVSRLPRLVKWIDAWLTTRIEEVSVDWVGVGELLGIDTGIFYGHVRDVMLVQALIDARHERNISVRSRELGDEIYETVKRAARAWYLTEVRRASTGVGGDQNVSTVTVFVSRIAAEYPKHRRLSSGGSQDAFAVDLHQVLCGAAGYSADDVFLEPDVASDFDRRLNESAHRSGLYAAVVFCALWGLGDASFDEVVSLIYRERRIIGGADLDHFVQFHGDEIAQLLSALVVPTGNVTELQELGKRRLELLLLPYWKDRWYLFEVWTLIFVLRLANSAGAQIALREVASAPGDVTGTVWNLPTQKAKRPVAEASHASNSILVWFQRETPRIDATDNMDSDAPRNMEPDVSISAGQPPYDYVAIVECKDRIKFSLTPSDRVAQSYLAGSPADPVWIVNYEDDAKVRCRVSPWNGRSFGVANGFRPQAVPAPFLESIRAVVRDSLDIGLPSTGLHYLVIDSSGSMDDKPLPNNDVVTAILQRGEDFVVLWNDCITIASQPQLDALRAPHGRITGSSAEDDDVFVTFVQGLSAGAAVTVVTDVAGHQLLLGRATEVPPERGSGFTVASVPVDFIVI